MNTLHRREFLKLFGAIPAMAAMGYMPFAKAKTSARVVIVGGGFGGATTAKYLKRFDASLDVTLVESNKLFVTCPFSNTVIGGMNDIDMITHGYKMLQDVHNIKVIHDTATEIDSVANKVKLKGGQTLEYDRLVLSPGIDFKWDAIDGYSEAASEVMPHAWKAGPQTLLLRTQLANMKDGGTVLICPPDNPFRCPPGPYERASLMAHYIKQHKPKSKIIILDAKDKFSKQPLFQDAWTEMYKDIIEWVPGSQGGKIASVDSKNMSVKTQDGETFKGDVINIIPPQKAAAISIKAGLTDDKGWSPVNQKTFESTLAKNVHIIGDSCMAGKMPKSGYAANSQGKVCAAEIVAAIRGETLKVSSWVNTCYSLVAPDYGISVAAVYRLTDKGIMPVEGAGGVGPRDAPRSTRQMESVYAQGWYKSITSDIFS